MTWFSHKQSAPKRRKRKRRVPFVLPHPTPVGAPPGLAVIDETSTAPPIQVVTYGPNTTRELTVDNVNDLHAMERNQPVTWINVDGVRHGETLRELGKMFHLHPLAVEDAAHVHQRPKIESYGEHLFVVVRMPSLAEELELEQLCLFVLHDIVITVQEGRPGDCLEPVRERIRSNKGRIRGAQADYLAYAVIDAVVDSYYPILEHYGDKLERLESRLMTSFAPDEGQRYDPCDQTGPL